MCLTLLIPSPSLTFARALGALDDYLVTLDGEALIETFGSPLQVAHRVVEARIAVFERLGPQLPVDQRRQKRDALDAICRQDRAGDERSLPVGAVGQSRVIRVEADAVVLHHPLA